MSAKYGLNWSCGGGEYDQLRPLTVVLESVQGEVVTLTTARAKATATGKDVTLTSG